MEDDSAIDEAGLVHRRVHSTRCGAGVRAPPSNQKDMRVVAKYGGIVNGEW